MHVLLCSFHVLQCGRTMNLYDAFKIVNVLDMSNDLVEIMETIIDGSIGEGGGQVLRSALSLSVLLNFPMVITNIRAGRSNPGLSHQHCAGVRLIRDVSNGQVSGEQVGSSTLHFHPGPRGPPLVTYVANAGTAGAISLMIQVSLPVIAFVNYSTNGDDIPTCTISYIGGTNVSMSPPIDFLSEILLPLLLRMGVKAEIEVRKRGYYPLGGGEVNMQVLPTRFCKPLQLDQRGYVTHINARVFGNCKDDVKEELRNSLRNELLSLRTEIMRRESDMHSSTSSLGVDLSVIIVSETISGDRQRMQHVISGATQQQKRKQKPQKLSLGAFVWVVTSTGCYLPVDALVISRAGGEQDPSVDVRALVGQLDALLLSGACADEYTADQLVLFMALAASATHTTSSSSSKTSSAEGGEGVDEEARAHEQRQDEGTSRILCAARKGPGHRSLHLETVAQLAQRFVGAFITIENVDALAECRLVTVTGKGRVIER